MKKYPANQLHEKIYKEISAVLEQYKDQLNAIEILAITSNIVGKVIALQDQRTMSPDHAMQIVKNNIELGNQQMLEIALNEKPAGNA